MAQREGREEEKERARERQTGGMENPGSQWEGDWKREDVCVEEPVKDR